jgi:hypothetical protein
MYPGNAPPAGAGTKRGATSALPGRRRRQKQELHTTYGHTTTQSRRHQETVSHQRHRLPPSDAADPLKLLRRRSRYRSPGTDRNPDEDRRGQTLEPLLIQPTSRTRQHRQAAARGRRDTSYLPGGSWKQPGTAHSRRRAATASTWRSTLIMKHE